MVFNISPRSWVWGQSWPVPIEYGSWASQLQGVESMYFQPDCPCHTTTSLPARAIQPYFSTLNPLRNNNSQFTTTATVNGTVLAPMIQNLSLTTLPHRPLHETRQ